MFDLSFLQILARAIAMVVVLTVMGFALAGFARLLGDKGTAYDGKLTLNPFVHVDVFALVAGVAGRIGWIRPIAIDPTHCLGGRIGPILAAIATMIVVFAFGRLGLSLLPGSPPPGRSAAPPSSIWSSARSP